MGIGLATRLGGVAYPGVVRTPRERRVRCVWRGARQTQGYRYAVGGSKYIWASSGFWRMALRQ